MNWMLSYVIKVDIDQVIFNQGCQVWLFNTNNSIKHQLFVYTQLNDQTVLFQTIQFSMSTKLTCSKYCYLSLTIQQNSHLFAHS